jgi:hypothetical protein
MSDRDEYLEAMRGMWGEMKSLNARLNTGLADLGGRIDAIGARLDTTNARIDVTNASLEATNERLDDLIVEVRGAVGLSHLDRRRLDRLESRVDALEEQKRR